MLTYGGMDTIGEFKVVGIPSIFLAPATVKNVLSTVRTNRNRLNYGRIIASHNS